MYIICTLVDRDPYRVDGVVENGKVKLIQGLVQEAIDEGNDPSAILNEGMIGAMNTVGAKFQANDLAKLDIAGKIATEVTALIETQIANKQLDPGEAATIAETVGASKNLISKRIGTVIPLMECYRILPNKNTEVRVMIGYSHKLALKAAKEVVHEELEKKGQNLMDQLNKAMGF